MSKPVLSIGFDVPFTEAIEWAKNRVSVLPDTYYNDLPATARSRAYTVSGLSALDQIQGVLDSLHKATAEGQTFAQWKKSLTPEVLALGNARLDNIFRTGIQTHYNIGRYQQQEANKAHRPYRMYDAINDGRTRPHHKALDNFIAPIDDPIWGKIYPPNGFRCRCSTITLTEAQAVQRGYKVGNQPDVNGGADKGWDYNPATGHDAKLEQIKAQRLAKVQADIRAAAEKAIDPVMMRPWKAAPETDEGQWHDAAFADSPQWIKDGIAKRPALKAGVTNKKDTGGAHFDHGDDSISMYGAQNKASPKDQGTWRHEYGHALDRSLDSGFFYRSASPDFTFAMQDDAADLIKLGAHGVKTHKVTKLARANLDKAYDDANTAMLAAEDKAKWLKERYTKAGIDFDQFEKTMKVHTDFATTLQGVGLQGRYAKAVVAIEERDAQGLMDALTGGLFSAEARQTWEKGIIGKLSDHIGSATKNKVSGYNKSGNGHPDAYYKNFFSAQAECFANLTCLYGAESPVFGQIVEAMTPKIAEVFKGILK